MSDRHLIPEVAHPDPAMHYRWLDVTPDRLSQALIAHGQRPGYKLVKGAKLADTKAMAEKLFGPGGEEMVNEVTNRIQFGNLVLGQIPMAEVVRRRAELKADRLDKLQASRDEYKDRATQRGIRPIEKELGEIQDRKEFASRDGGGRVSLAGLDVPNQRSADDSAE